jgi:imidazolonepropionase-like amidohydrolase
MVVPLLGFSLAAQQSPAPVLPADVPKDADVRVMLIDETPSGQDAVWTTPDGTLHELFQFNDRGRGPKIYTTYRLDARQLIAAEDSKGVDYMKAPVEEHFSITSGQAVWKNQAEDRTLANAGGKFYVDVDGGPASGELLARALLANGGKLAVLPSGEVTIRAVRSLPVEANRQRVTVTLYEINGLAFTPSYLWLDDQRHLFATSIGLFGMVRQGFQSVHPALRTAQEAVENARAADVARALVHVPTGDVVITNVTLFDAENGVALAQRRVTIRGARIVAVQPESSQATSAAAEVIDGSGKMLLPGLWDMHAHLFPLNAYLDIAAGVTTARDLGNPIDLLTPLRTHIAEGTQIGPRVIAAGFIDGPGPFEGPIKVLAATPEEARERVDHYAGLGYVQIKIYSSVKPELVPVIIAEAHKRGLRVSGHVPAGMIAEQFIAAGADEVQHMNFVFLNFMPDVKETRTPARFIEPGKRGADLDLDSPRVNTFIALLKDRHTVIDPTMGVWEATYTDRPGTVPKIEAAMFDRLPVQVQRGILAGGSALPVPDGTTDQRYRASYANMERMLRKLYDNGVQLVAGTDGGSGYALHRELEIYEHVGIPAAAVLRMATLEAARVMHQEKDLGSITPGKFADLILVDGDPLRQISDIRKILLVVKDGKLLRPAEMYHAIGVQ